MPQTAEGETGDGSGRPRTKRRRFQNKVSEWVNVTDEIRVRFVKMAGKDQAVMEVEAPDGTPIEVVEAAGELDNPREVEVG